MAVTKVMRAYQLLATGPQRSTTIAAVLGIERRRVTDVLKALRVAGIAERDPGIGTAQRGCLPAHRPRRRPP